VTGGLLLALALGGALQQPDITASVDRATIARGDTVVLTIHVAANGNEPVRIADPDLSGLELVDSRETSRVLMVGGVAQRVTQRVLRLRAVLAGRARIGGLRVEQAGRASTAADITITVTSAALPPAPLEPAIRRIVDAAPPPSTPDQVALVVLPSRRSVVLGEQVDLVTLAWFPREVRSRLRTIPSFEGPDVQGGWAYQHAGPAGVALSRRVGDQWYDLFLEYETVFPLQTGVVRVGRASVSYSLPLTYSFLSRELRHVVQSDSLSIEVAPDPPAGRPARFRGAAGGGLSLQVEPLSEEMAVGDARTVTVSIEGRGNVALWPEPDITWPDGIRAYPGDVQVSVRREDGQIRGKKAFSYLIVADSAGVYRLSAPVYAYFDLDAHRYVELAGARLDIVARPGTGPMVARPVPPPLLMPDGSRVPPLTRAPLALWILLGVAPLAVMGLRGVRRRTVSQSLDGARALGRLDSLERNFRHELEHLVPSVSVHNGAALADALRAAGVEAALAEHVARVRDRLRQALYGRGGATDLDELAAEVEEVLRGLLGERAPRGRSGTFARVLVVCLVLLPSAVRGQAPSPERLYMAGALRAAADSFASRAAAQPHVAAHWYNLGDALYRLGSDAQAEAAWVRAARLAPRDPEIERALGLVPPGDPLTERLLWVGPLTPDEALALAVGLWIAGWLIGLRRRWRPLASGLIVAALVAGAYGTIVWWRYRQPLALTVEAETPLRQAPYSSAPAPGRLREGTAVVVQSGRPGWLLVRYGKAVGWVQSKEVVPL
jgi:hypothetical protein